MSTEVFYRSFYLLLLFAIQPVCRQPIFDLDARDALSFELWRDVRPDHAIPDRHKIVELILESRWDAEATFDPTDVLSTWLRLDIHCAQAVEFEDLVHRQHVQLLFTSAFMSPFDEPGQ